ncbi:hypothetical protein DAEQUDRAFT_727541 [Daedalea quercina L-15889]|uniref:Uncharacterized protein n=1 Tax=Daedalea quercina L-15889 TaxID=1314783 RepID=A0A165PVD5_9APHY|nr:hypothetical protein DAEQUDRAFT_727541 [Daedalea quercina L-15889]
MSSAVTERILGYLGLSSAPYQFVFSYRFWKKLLYVHVQVFHMSWIEDSVAWGFLLPVSGYLLDGTRRGGIHSFGADEPHVINRHNLSSVTTLPAEDSQATLCVTEDNMTVAQDEQEPSISQTLVCSAMDSTSTITIRRKSSPELDSQQLRRPRKSIRILDFIRGADAPYSPTPRTTRSGKREPRIRCTPYLDLRKMTRPTKAPSLKYEALDASGARMISTASAELIQAMEDGSDEDHPRISVSLALDILRDVPTNNAVRFIPGKHCRGKEFRCKLISHESEEVKK